MANTKAFKVKNGLELQGYDTSIADTALAIFVYDTAKDSDGGAWRNRVQNTSWYKETLNTATRGSRKDFPAVAVIVATSTGVTIYDGDDPSLPMWMVFQQDGGVTQGTTRYYISGAVTITDVVMLDGKLVVSSTYSNPRSGIDVIDFILDSGVHITNASANTVQQTQPIARRNSLSAVVNLEHPVLLSDQCFGLAMTVLPNAPMDEYRQMPVPTIAVGNNGGLSVIKDDGTVVNLTTTASVYDGVEVVDIVGKKLVYSSQQSGSSTNQWRLKFIDIPDTSVSGAYLTNLDGYQLDSRGSIGVSPPLNTDSDLGAATNDIKATVVGRAAGYTDKLTMILGGLTSAGYLSNNAYADIATAYITKDYNSGWQSGKIRLATCADTDATTITGSELVTNGDFASSTGWYFNGTGVSVGSGWSIASGAATSDGTGGDIYSEISVVNGVTYTMTIVVDLTANAGPLNNISIGFRQSNNGGYYGPYISQAEMTAGTSQTFQLTWTATLTGTVIVRCFSDEVVSLDNWSVRAAVEDRSYNNTGLQIFGTVAREAVATGADLVGYTSFSSTDYLRGYPNLSSSTLTQGMLYGWFLHDGTGSTQEMVRLGNNSTASYYMSFIRETSSNDESWGVAMGGSGGSLSYFLTETSAANQWYFLCFTFNGNQIRFYVNQELKAEFSDSYSPIPLGADPYLGIGNLPLNVTGDNFRCALVRFSETISSPEQIKEIYESEKGLFESNAKATLYGSSNEITALAYDESTELIHAGTSSGRSVFHGLQRVDNTTNAVGKTISAANNLVADE